MTPFTRSAVAFALQEVATPDGIIFGRFTPEPSYEGSTLEEIAADYHVYLARNHQALKDQDSNLRLDLGLGPRSLPLQPVAERRRTEIGREIAALDRRARRRVFEVLEPVGAWHVLTLPTVLVDLDPADPRSL